MKPSILFLFLFLSIFSYSQDLNIPDAVFLNKLISQGVDTNGDGIIQLSEALAVTHLNVNAIGAAPKIEDMEGIQHFTNLIELRCANNLITLLDVTALTNLEFLHCNNNQITSLNITGLSQLTRLWANGNALTQIDLSGLDNIWWIWVSNNNLDQIDLTGLFTLEAFEIANNLVSIIDFTPTPNLNYVDVSGNSLTEIEVNHLTALELLYCQNNQIEEISISNLVNLYTLYIGNNLIEEIDGSLNPNFIELHCQSNPNLIYINMKNGAISPADSDMLYHGFNFYNLPNLQFICIDPGEEYALSESGYNPNNVTVSTTDCTMSVTDIALNEIILYPNPVVDFFNITNVNAVSEFIVLDVTGKILFDTTLFETAQKKIINLKTGTYFLILNDESNSLKQFRFIKK
jgi:hypothetical protein